MLSAIQDTRILADRFFAGKAGDLLKCRVDVLNDASGIRDKNGFGRLPKGSYQALPFLISVLTLGDVSGNAECSDDFALHVPERDLCG